MITALDKNTALVLIDLQNGIANYPTVHPMKDIIANAAKLVEAFHKAGLPVVAVNADPRKFKQVRKEPSNFSMPPIQDEWLEIVAELGTRPDDIYVTKASWGVFGTTDLDEKLKALGVTGIVLGGVATSIGVEGTARAAGELGYNMTFAMDAMTDMQETAHQHSLQSIFPRLGEVGTTDEIIAKLNG